MNAKLKKTLKNLDLLLTQRVLKKNKFFLLFYKSNKDTILVKSKDIYFFKQNKYPLILLKFNVLNNLLNFSKINKKNILLISISNFTYKNYSLLNNYLSFQYFLIFLVHKNLVIIKQLQNLNSNFFSIFKIFNSILTNK